jgi:hypothetical protein
MAQGVLTDASADRPVLHASVEYTVTVTLDRSPGACSHELRRYGGARPLRGPDAVAGAGTMKTRELRERLMVALVNSAKGDNLGDFLEPATVADQYGLDRQPGQLRLIVDDLEARGFVRASRTLGGGDEGGLDLRLTAAAVEAVEELLEDHPEYAEPAAGLSSAPASDRYVTLTDNQRAGVVGDIRDLSVVVSGANDVGDEERQIALSEIAAFEATIIQSRVPADLVERFTKRVLSWILTVFGAALAGEIAQALIAKLLPFLG